MSKIKSEKAMAVTETVSPKDVTERGRLVRGLTESGTKTTLEPHANENIEKHSRVAPVKSNLS